MVIMESSWKEKYLPQISIKSSQFSRKSLKTYRESRFLMAQFEACHSQECYFIFPFTFLVFLSCFYVFIIFIFLDEVRNFRNRILTNQKPEYVITNCQLNCFNIKMSKFTLHLNQSFQCPQFSQTTSSRLQMRIQNPVKHLR